jgi:hypothetical protein
MPLTATVSCHFFSFFSLTLLHQTVSMFPLLSPTVATYIHNFFTKNKLMRIIFYEKFIYVHNFFTVIIYAHNFSLTTIYVHKFVTKDNLYTYFFLYR